MHVPGTPVHALELAHAAKLNLDTAWGVGESCVPGPKPHRGCDAGSGFVAVAGLLSWRMWNRRFLMN